MSSSMNTGILSIWQLPDQKEAFQHALPKKLSIPLCLGGLPYLRLDENIRAGVNHPIKAKVGRLGATGKEGRREGKFSRGATSGLQGFRGLQGIRVKNRGASGRSGEGG